MSTPHDLGVAIALALVAAATTVHVPPPGPTMADVQDRPAVHRPVVSEEQGPRNEGGDPDRQSDATGQAAGPASCLIFARLHGGQFGEQASRWAISHDFGERRCAAPLLLVEDFGELLIDRALAADVESQVQAWCILAQDTGGGLNELQSPGALSATDWYRAPEPH